MTDNVLVYDCFSGISGDMHIGAMLDIGVPEPYLRSELEYEDDNTYEILTGRVRPWSYSGYENRYVNVAETLREAMTKNPALRTFVASGYYDLATPYFATDYTFSHLGLEFCCDFLQRFGRAAGR